MYGHAHLLLELCDECGERPVIVITKDQRLCARCGLAAEREN